MVAYTKILSVDMTYLQVLEDLIACGSTLHWVRGRSDKLKLLDVNRTGVDTVDLTRFPALRSLKINGSLINWIDLRDFQGIEKLELGYE